MPDDEDQIRTLIHRWARAVHDGDLPSRRDHADKHRDVSTSHPLRRRCAGLDAYRETCPPFFDGRHRAAVFDIESLDGSPAARSLSPTP